MKLFLNNIVVQRSFLSGIQSSRKRFLCAIYSFGCTVENRFHNGLFVFILKYHQHWKYIRSIHHKELHKKVANNSALEKVSKDDDNDAQETLLITLQEMIFINF